MVLARPTLAAKNTEPVKILAPSRMMLFAGGVAVLSAAAVFLFLILREQRTPILVNAGPASAGMRAQPAASNAKPEIAASRIPNPDPADFDRFNFSLARSRSYRSVGPIRVRLLRTDKTDAYDIAILVKNKRTKKSRMKPGEPIEIAIPGSLPDSRMVVTRIAKNQVWGYLVTPKSAIKPVVQIRRRH